MCLSRGICLDYFCHVYVSGCACALAMQSDVTKCNVSAHARMRVYARAGLVACAGEVSRQPAQNARDVWACIQTYTSSARVM